MNDPKSKKPNAIVDYLEESFQELKKVTWPTRNQAVKLTILVLVFCLISAVVIGAVDAILSYGHQKMIDVAPQGTSTAAATETPYTAEAQPVTAEAQGTPITIKGNGQQVPVTVTPKTSTGTTTGSTQTTN
jgi:preprotein translocase SecE subunit